MDWIANAAIATATGIGNHLLDLAGVAAVAVAAYAARYATEHWAWADALISEERVKEEAMRAVAFAKARAEEYTEGPEIGGPEFVEQTVKYVVDRAPKAMAKAGITEQSVREYVEDALD